MSDLVMTMIVVDLVALGIAGLALLANIAVAVFDWWRLQRHV
jgi:hypothetical protein